MKIAIHNSNKGFQSRWIPYCQQKGIPYKLVNCYDSDLVAQLHDCDALMWHHSQLKPKDLLVAKQILFALEHAGFTVFPDFNTAWHFDDKVAQKYLLEAIDAPLVPSYVFFSKEEAMDWAAQTDFPKVWKLRGGAGSANVRLVRTRAQAEKMIKQAFGRGFSQYAPWDNMKERWRRYKLGKANTMDLAKGLARFVYPPDYARIPGRDRGYIYFQDFIPNNTFDIRMIVIDGRAFGTKRMVRKNDFRASGSGIYKYEREEFDERFVQLSFELTKKLGLQCVGYDFVVDEQDNPLVVEISYGYTVHGPDGTPGHWDEDLNWIEGLFNPQEWVVDALVRTIKEKKQAHGHSNKNGLATVKR